MEREISTSEWVDKYGDYLYRYALLRLRNKTVAEDVVQETFLAALQNVKQFSAQSSERTWLTGILKHKIIDHFRRSAREKPLEDSATFESDEAFIHGGLKDGHWKQEHLPADWGNDPSSEIERKQFWEILERCLDRLPPKMAQAFVLREVEELSTGEICAILNITESNLWVMLHRARAQLRAGLEAEYFARR